jgi:hypothetical protein
MLGIAPRIIWFEPPDRALADPVRFMAYAMTYARHEDMSVIREYVSDADFREALDRAPPGIIDPRSWAYWNSKMGRYPPPPLPKRHFGDEGAETQRQRGDCDARIPAVDRNEEHFTGERHGHQGNQEVTPTNAESLAELVGQSAAEAGAEGPPMGGRLASQPPSSAVK